jgi:hypothetical protein
MALSDQTRYQPVSPSVMVYLQVSFCFANGNSRQVLQIGFLRHFSAVFVNCFGMGIRN